MEPNSSKRLIGTDSLTQTYCQDTPGQTAKNNVKKLAKQCNEAKVEKLSKAKFPNYVIVHPNKKDSEHSYDEKLKENDNVIATSLTSVYDCNIIEGRNMANHKGGGKKRQGLETESANHIINQLRIVKNLRDPSGTPVTFDDKSCYLVDEEYAEIALKIYDSLEKPTPKEAFVKKLSISPHSFVETISQSSENLITHLEKFIKEQRKHKKITLAEKVQPELSSHRLYKVILEDNSNSWVSKLIFRNGTIAANMHTKDEGIYGLNKLRQHIQENIANYYNIPFIDNTL